MKAPSAAQWTFCAATAISVSASTSTAAASPVNGGQTATSTPSSPANPSRSSRQKSRVSVAVLNIFQLPAISMGLA